MNNSIKLYFCSLAYRDEALNDLIPFLANIGYDGIEVFFNHIKNLSDQELCELKALADHHAIQLAVVSPYFWLTQSPSLLQESYDIADSAIKMARLLGSEKVRTFTDAGPTGISSQLATEAQWETAVQALKDITNKAPELQFVVETHPLTLADTAESSLRLLDRVQAPNLKINFQPGGLIQLFEDYATLKPHISHVHLQSANADGAHIYLEEEGTIDAKELIQELIKDEYRGSISVEYCWKNVPRFRAQTAYDFLKPLLNRS